MHLGCANQVFAEGFLTRHPTHTVSAADGQTLRLWFDEPRLTLLGRYRTSECDTQKNSRPGHPTTCGKVERFQQTMKKWLRAQPHQPTTITELQALLDTF